MAKAFDVVTPAKCLGLAAEYITGNEANVKWQSPASAHPDQALFLAGYERYLRHANELSGLKAAADVDVKKINAFLRTNGFPLAQLPEKPIEPDVFFIASLYKLIFMWLVEGKTSDDYGNEYTLLGDKRPAYYMAPKDSNRKIAIRILDGNREKPIIEIKTKDEGKMVYIVPSPEISGMSLISLAEQTIKSVNSMSLVYGFDGVVLPHLGLDIKVTEAEIFKGIFGYTHAGRARIADAAQQVKLRMNPEGVLTGAATSMEVVLESIAEVKPHLYVDYPAIIFVRDGHSTNLAVTHVSPADFSKVAISLDS